MEGEGLWQRGAQHGTLPTKGSDRPAPHTRARLPWLCVRGSGLRSSDRSEHCLLIVGTKGVFSMRLQRPIVLRVQSGQSVLWVCCPGVWTSARGLRAAPGAAPVIAAAHGCLRTRFASEFHQEIAVAEGGVSRFF